MRSVKTIHDMSLTIEMRKDFYESLKDELTELMDFSNVCYFAHHFVQNYYSSGFFISSFVSCEEWQDTYWQKYWHDDPLERKVYKNAILNGSSMIPWNLSDPKSDCMMERKRISGADNGVMMALKHSNTLIESVSFGWKKEKKVSNVKALLNQTDGAFQKIQKIHFDAFKSHRGGIF